MPKPKDKKRSFDVQVQSALSGVRVMPQAAGSEGERSNLPENPTKHSQPRRPESLVVEKLIDFLKAMD